MQLFGTMGRISEALEALAALPGVIHASAQAVQGGITDSPELADVRLRVEALERERQQLLAEVEALTNRAESKLAASRAAEERARGMKNRAEELTRSVEGDEEGEEGLEELAAYLQSRDAGGGGNGGVHPVREDVGRPLSGKEAAKAYKYGR